MIVIMDGGQHGPPRKKCGPGYHLSSKTIPKKASPGATGSSFSLQVGLSDLSITMPK